MKILRSVERLEKMIGGTTGGQSRRRGSMPSVVGLVGGVVYPPERGTPPGGNPAARGGRTAGGSGLDGVSALAAITLGRRNGQSHLLPDRPRQEPTNRMRQPARGLHEFLRGDPAGPLEQIQDLGGLAAIAGFGLGGLGFRAALGRFLPLGGPLPHLGLGGRDVRATWRNTGLLGGFRLVARGRGLRRCRFLLSSTWSFSALLGG
jgi:hypothetical protein